nr:stalk domain-containing protein [Flavonifractor sp. An135]
MKKSTHIAARLAAVLLLAVGLLCVPAAAAGEITVYVDGRQLSFDQPPVAMNNRTLVPLRAIFEALGAQVEWYPEKQGISAQKGDTLIVMQLGGKTFAKQVGNGEAQYIELDQPPVAINNRTLVPVRAVSESFDCDVTWDAAGNRVLITTAGGSQTGSTVVDDDRVYFNAGHQADGAYTSAILEDGVLYFNFVNRATLYIYDGSTVRSWNAGDHPRDIIARDGKVYYYGHNNGAVYCLDAATGERETLLTSGDLDDVEQLKLYRNYLLASDGDSQIYAVDLNTGAGRMLDEDHAVLFTAAGEKVYILSHLYLKEENRWRYDLVEADPATGSTRTLYTGIGNQLFCAGDGSGVYFYETVSGSKTYYFYDAATGSSQTVSESAYSAAETGYNRTNDTCWTEDWYFGSNNSGVYRKTRDGDLRETLYNGSGCRYLTNDASHVVFIQSENGFNAGSVGSGWGDTSVYIMDLNGNGLTEIINNGETSSSGSNSGDLGGGSIQPMACPVCHGSGQMVCALCEGNKVDFYGNRCSFCGGSGWRVCPGCNGAGTINP